MSLTSSLQEALEETINILAGRWASSPQIRRPLAPSLVLWIATALGGAAAFLNLAPKMLGLLM
jgi:hypothetical protein